jgi:predicted amidohydrolase
MMIKLSLVQLEPLFGNTKHNIEKLFHYANNVEADILVFPELCTTGYFFQSRKESASYSESFIGKTVSDLQKLSTEQDKIIVFGFAESWKDKLFNSAAILFPEKELSRVYRKTHLFYKERFCFDPGDTGFFVIDYSRRDIRLGTMICYDWRFPEAARSLGLLGADLIVCPSNLVTHVWHKVMPARALENKCYLAVANRIGKEERNGEEVAFNGDSGIWSYNGDLITKAGSSDETVINTMIDPEKTRNKSFNEFNDIFGDRRPDMYINNKG